MMVQHWDSVLNFAFPFCDALNPESRMFEYCVGWITSSFGKSKIMGMDKVYIEMLNGVNPFVEQLMEKSQGTSNLEMFCFANMYNKSTIVFDVKTQCFYQRCSWMYTNFVRSKLFDNVLNLIRELLRQSLLRSHLSCDASRVS